MKTRFAAALALPALAFAQTPPNPAATPSIDKRQANQEKRIDQGVASGQLTNRETARLDRGENHIDRMENRAKSDGTVTKQARAKIHHAQDVDSKRIHRQKHDAQIRKD